MKKHLICILSVWLLTACSHPVNNPEKTEEWPEIYPDYIGVTIPATIAPMNFDYIGGKHDRIDVIVTGNTRKCPDSLLSGGRMAQTPGIQQGRQSVVYSICQERKQMEAVPPFLHVCQ